REEDCGTTNGIILEDLREGENEVIEGLQDRIIGRYAQDDVVNPESGELIVKANEEITESLAKAMVKANVTQVKVRSVLACRTRNGVCVKCYGRNLATNKSVGIGEAVG
ncbi:MAG TPA: hypothetical protein DDZ65_04055, partial [Firmicutes bacterium]|nr:hypothetical protein [Bacillota bacterium]